MFLKSVLILITWKNLIDLECVNRNYWKCLFYDGNYDERQEHFKYFCLFVSPEIVPFLNFNFPNYQLPD